MALTFPLSLVQFYDTLFTMEGDVYLPDALGVSRDAAGNIYTDDLGERLWMGSFTQARRVHSELRKIEARLSVLRESGASFMVCDPRAVAPASDPTGSILGVFVPTINSLAANSRELSITNLPGSYQITRGDRLAWTYVSGGVTKYAYHEVVTGLTANGAGTTGNIEVTPWIRPGVVIGAAVTLINPAFKAVYLPSSLQPSRGRGAQSEGLSFGFIQSLKG